MTDSKAAMDPTAIAPAEPTRLATQTVGNIGLYFVCYRLSQHGWNVMPTARNARGIDILGYSQDGKKTVTVQVKALSARNAALLGSTLDGFIAQFVIAVLQRRTRSRRLVPSRRRRTARRLRSGSRRFSARSECRVGSPSWVGPYAAPQNGHGELGNPRH